jgi:hypothetical protein
MSEGTSKEVGATTPYRPSNVASDWVLPLRSDPPWMLGGLAGVTAASLGGFAAIFRLFDPRVPVGLSLLPGLTAATFLGSALVYVGRRRGATLELHARNNVLRVRSREDDIPWLDARDSSTFGVLVLEDPRSPVRLFLFTQGAEPTIVLDPSGAALPDPWKSRVIRTDFASLPVSSESAGAVEIARGASAAPMLDTLARALDDAHLLRQPLPSGEVLTLGPTELRVGDRRVVLDDPEVHARRISIATPAGEVLGLSITSDVTSLLFACIDPTADGATADVDAPDAYLHPAVFTALSARLKASEQTLRR